MRVRFGVRVCEVACDALGSNFVCEDGSNEGIQRGQSIAKTARAMRPSRRPAVAVNWKMCRKDGAADEAALAAVLMGRARAARQAMQRAMAK